MKGNIALITSLSAFTLLLNSCATLLNSKIQTIAIVPEDKMEILSVKQDTTIIQGRFEHYITLRSNQPLEVSFLNLQDSQIRTITKYPIRSNTYWWNIFSNYGLGMVVDEFSNKKYAFPRKTYLTNDNMLVMERKGKIRLYLPLEYVFFTRNQWNEDYQYMSMMGQNLSIGLEYYYKHNTFLAGGLHLGYYVGLQNRRVLDYDVGLLSHVRHGHVFNNFELAYGLSMLQTSQFSTIGIGVIGTQMFTRVTGCQMGFEPHFYDLNTMTFSYQPSLRMGLVFKINGNK